MSTKTGLMIKKLIPMLKESIHGCTKKELALKLGLSQRNITRYLYELRDMNFKLVSSGQKPKIWKIEGESPPIDCHDIASLKMVQEKLRDAGNFSFDDTIGRLERKLSFLSGEKAAETACPNLNGDEYFNVYHGPNTDYKDKKGIIARLYTAIKQTETLQVDYRKPGAKIVVTHECNPLGLVLLQGRLYLIAASAGKSGNIYTLFVSRVLRIVSTGVKFRRPLFSLRDYFKDSMGVWRTAIIVHLKIRIHEPWMVDFLRELEIHASKRIVKKGREVYLLLDVCWGPDVKGWILSWGSYLEVIEPLEIRKEIEREIGDMYYHYIKPLIPKYE